jgi:hypothetical protein
MLEETFSSRDQSSLHSLALRCHSSYGSVNERFLAQRNTARLWAFEIEPTLKVLILGLGLEGECHSSDVYQEYHTLYQLRPLHLKNVDPLY